MQAHHVHRLWSIGLATLTIGAVASGQVDVPRYHVTDLTEEVLAQWPDVTYPRSQSRALNEDGDFVGEAYTGSSQQQAWVHTAEHGLVPLPLVDGFPSNVALDVSDRLYILDRFHHRY